MSGLTYYRVKLWEAKYDNHTIHFDCWAEDIDHAFEQAEKAYPNCEIAWAEPLEESDESYPMRPLGS